VLDVTYNLYVSPLKHVQFNVGKFMCQIGCKGNFIRKLLFYCKLKMKITFLTRKNISKFCFNAADRESHLFEK